MRTRSAFRPTSTLTAILAALPPLVACGDGSPPERVGATVERDTIGDTVVVRTVSGSAWGEPARLVAEVAIGELDGPFEYLFGQPVSLGAGADGTIYVVDRQGPELRAYGPDGTYRATLAGAGEGPGELKGPDGGLAVLSDGRILVRDPGNARIQVFGPDGEPVETWPLRGGFSTGSPMLRDVRDNVYVHILVDPQADVRDWVIGRVRIGPDGVAGDTLVPPDVDYEAPALEARREGSVSRTGVPFSPGEDVAMHPGGYFVHGVATEYAVTLHRPGAPLRIERTYEPIPVAAGERREEELRVTRNMRRNQEGWRWNGPAIPDHKPPFRDLYTGRDGRIWVHVSMPGVQRDDPDYDPTDPDAVPDEWTEPVAWDVFEEDGTYLGRVDAPEGFRTYPTPVFDGDLVWATAEDELGVIRVVRYRVERGAGTED